MIIDKPQKAVLVQEFFKNKEEPWSVHKGWWRKAGILQCMALPWATHRQLQMMKTPAVMTRKHVQLASRHNDVMHTLLRLPDVLMQDNESNLK
jgi:hypothetical protein